ncbi:ABC transporter permease [Caulobacter endophyticus]|uniref:ABC transporter permease n=1 Tax=Caulobacter endophyticus TaxID=2172652 RepID=UPI00240EA34D|nr:ABC transporter permease [Caulobacter endophyticus]MDG2528804.1 ABC transporter permease [Caulobacter endophyticus]
MSNAKLSGDVRRFMRLTPRNPFVELLNTLGLWRLWMAMGVTDIQQRYRNSVLGPLWLASGLGLTVVGLSLLYSQILRVPFQDFAPYLAAGLMFWTFIASTGTEGCHAYAGAEGLIKSLQVPYFVYVFRVVFRNVIVMAHNLIVVAIVWVVFGKYMLVKPVEAAFGIALMIIFTTGMTTLFAAIGALFRDFMQIVVQVFQIAIFITPVFWLSNTASVRSEFLHFNPFYYMLEVARAPLLGVVPSPHVYMGAIALALGSLVAGFVAYSVSRKSIVFYI